MEKEAAGKSFTVVYVRVLCLCLGMNGRCGMGIGSREAKKG